MSSLCSCGDEFFDPDCPLCHGTGEIPDGFRDRVVRPKGWLKAAIADGSVHDPSLPFPDQPAPAPGAVVVNPPVATMTGEGD